MNKNIRLGGGEYNIDEMATWEARIFFLDAVAEVAPEVLKELQRDVYPLFKENKLLEWLSVYYIPGHEQLRDKLKEWGENNNLDFEFVYDAALYTMFYWRQFDDKDITFLMPGTAYFIPVDRRGKYKVEFKAIGWDPAGETRDDFKQRIMADFESYIDDYMDKLENLMEKRGVDKTPMVKRTEHFEWLALRLIYNKSDKEIADIYYNNKGKVVGDEAIKKGIAKAASFLELS